MLLAIMSAGGFFLVGVLPMVRRFVALCFVMLCNVWNCNIFSLRLFATIAALQVTEGNATWRQAAAGAKPGKATAKLGRFRRGG